MASIQDTNFIPALKNKIQTYLDRPLFYRAAAKGWVLWLVLGVGACGQWPTAPDTEGQIALLVHFEVDPLAKPVTVKRVDSMVATVWSSNKVVMRQDLARQEDHWQGELQVEPGQYNLELEAHKGTTFWTGRIALTVVAGETTRAQIKLSRSDASSSGDKAQLLNTKSCPGCNLIGVDLLGGVDLAGANLRGAQLAGAILADLRGADLRGADLRQGFLIDTKLDGANLEGANLSKANLSEANLRGANLKKADLHDADMFRADLREANLVEANLAGANLVEANLAGANLSGARIDRARLKGADLSGTIWVDGRHCGVGLLSGSDGPGDDECN